MKIQGVYELGDLVLLSKKRQGIIKYIGQLHNKDGVFYGIELTGKHKGENNGNVGKHQYFECDEKGKGIFVKPKKLVQILAKSSKKHKHSHSKSKSKSKSKSYRERSPSPEKTPEPAAVSPRDIQSMGSPSSVENDEYHLDDPKSYEPAHAPSQHVMDNNSNLGPMSQNVPKHDNSNLMNGFDPAHSLRHHSPVYQPQIDESDYVLTPGGPESDLDDLADVDDDGDQYDVQDDSVGAGITIDGMNENQNQNQNGNGNGNGLDDIDTKREKIKRELNNLRPIDLMEKLSEFMINTELDGATIEILSKMINHQPSFPY